MGIVPSIVRLQYEMVLQTTFHGLESFIDPVMFESEMKFLRNSEECIKPSRGDKEQSVEYGKYTTLKTRAS